MHILVLGAGVVGTTTAWFLRKQGHEVTVVDRQSQAGIETSYANGGQISVSHAEPWANPSAPLKVLKWLVREDAPLLFRPRLDPYQWRWAIAFLTQCTRGKASHNIRQMVNLGTYSRSQLQALRKETGIEYDHLEKGILHFYTDPDEFEGAREPTRIMQDLGCDRQIIDAARAVELEPALKPIGDRIAGATYTREDESGDARKFTQNLAGSVPRPVWSSAMAPKYSGSSVPVTGFWGFVPSGMGTMKPCVPTPMCSASAVSAPFLPALWACS